MPDSAKERDDKLEDIARRSEAVIRGPWAWFGNVVTHQVYLGTCHSGRIIILTPGTVKEEYVYDHGAERTYTLAEARAKVPSLCGAHGDEHTPARPEDCRCDEIYEMLRGELDIEEGARHCSNADGYWMLSRNMRINTELRFQGRGNDGAPDIILHSYRDDDVARYEVLHGKTMSEHLGGGGQRSDLYREDIVGIATPEAELIAHAPEDIAFLLAEIERLEDTIADMAT